MQEDFEEMAGCTGAGIAEGSQALTWSFSEEAASVLAVDCMHLFLCLCVQGLFFGDKERVLDGQQ